MALAYTVDTERSRTGPVDAYECDFCDWWHIGTRRPKLRKPIQCVEIGERAWFNLKAENAGLARRRLSIIARRFHRRGREAIDPGNKAAKERRAALRQRMAS